jgi:ABC-type uncharacterized transport system YnjBCD ATPase subunit
MEVLALEGNSNCGKSETLNIVYQMLLSDGFTQIAGNFAVLGNPKMRDFTDVLTKENKIIGIVTQGDYVIGKDSIAKHLNKLFLAGCSVAICACTNNNPKAKLQVMKYTPNTFFIKNPTYTTSVESLERVLNNIIATQIFNAI